MIIYKVYHVWDELDPFFYCSRETSAVLKARKNKPSVCFHASCDLKFVYANLVIYANILSRGNSPLLCPEIR